jgi:hypothetical protein
MHAKYPSMKMISHSVNTVYRNRNGLHHYLCVDVKKRVVLNRERCIVNPRELSTCKRMTIKNNRRRRSSKVELKNNMAKCHDMCHVPAFRSYQLLN